MRILLAEDEVPLARALVRILEKSNYSADAVHNGLDALQYLESGDVVFYAVGLAHLLDQNNGLVFTLREAGYTVTLVEYQ